MRPYLLANYGYPLGNYMLKNFKPPDGDPYEIRFDKQMNGGRIFIDNALVCSKVNDVFSNQLDVK